MMDNDKIKQILADVEKFLINGRKEIEIKVNTKGQSVVRAKA